ncbi:putative inner membrane protein [Vibrio ishigakensis]|uniref:Putative inner membrane protein n=1 Tax=Vibrio ishigakensis TaxID=1481914 RepID=A0A0B8QDJ3_9VIBR|nr:putative inner membrane protein [Vibrio ishigakensis]
MSEFIIEAITVLGTAAFALSAVLAALNKRVDIFSVMVLGIVTAVGGGTIRDCILNVPVFWSQEISYFTIACIASISGFFLFPLLKMSLINKLYLYIDALAIAMFGIQVQKRRGPLALGCHWRQHLGGDYRCRWRCGARQPSAEAITVT